MGSTIDSTNLSVANFILEINNLNKSNKIDVALDLIYEYIDSLLWNKSYSNIDIILESVAIEKLDTSILLAFLTATVLIRPKIKYIKKFYFLVERELVNRKEDKEGLLYGLEFL